MSFVSQIIAKPEQDSIEVRFQTKDRKVFEKIKLKLFDPLEVAMKKFADLRRMPVDTLKFVFDGDKLSGKDTPLNLDMEEGDAIDVVY